jgi:hypothetical protein
MLDIRYSAVYDELLSVMKRKKYSNKQYVEMERFAAELEEFWKKEGNFIRREIEKVSGLRFRKKVRCFVVKDMAFNAISYPLTIKFNKNMEIIKSNLIHELIHILLRDNQKVLDYVKKKFDYEDNDFKVHFPILLIQRKVIENLYGKKFFDRMIKYENKIDELGYEWERVNKHYNSFDKNIGKFLQNVVK